MKRRWRVVLLRNRGEILGEVEAPNVASAKAAAAVRFGLDEIQRARRAMSGDTIRGRASTYALAALDGVRA
jgi:hypothetical protein